MKHGCDDTCDRANEDDRSNDSSFPVDLSFLFRLILGHGSPYHGVRYDSMHREPYEVVPRRDLWIDGFLVRAGYIINVTSFDRETGAITIPVAAPGSSLCEHQAVIPRSRYPEFRIRWEWRTSTDRGSRLVQLAALAYLAPIWIGADLLRASDLPGLRRLGDKLHPKRGH